MVKLKYRNLIIVGNGFDRWVGLPCSYKDFCDYYHEHILDLARSLKCKIYENVDELGNSHQSTAIEFIYGDPFNPKLDDSFFLELESRMDKIDDQRINFIFNRSDDDTLVLRKAVKEAKILLKTIFSNWINTLDINSYKSDYKFRDDCFVINFNYTDTLEKLFGLDKSNIFYIHGQASNPDSIIVGHSSHPETALMELKEHHFLTSMNDDGKLPRVERLYEIENLLYETDKHIVDNIDKLCVYMLENDVHIEDFENIYVLGCSFSSVDMMYFNFINKATKCGSDFNKLSPKARINKTLLENCLNGDYSFDIMQQSLLYVFNRSSEVKGEKIDYYPELKELDKQYEDFKTEYNPHMAWLVNQQRFWIEQAQRTRNLLEDLEKKYKTTVPKDCNSILEYAKIVDGGHDKRKRNARWIISYYSQEDKERITKTLKEYYIKHCILYDSIEECLINLKGS